MPPSKTSIRSSATKPSGRILCEEAKYYNQQKKKDIKNLGQFQTEIRNAIKDQTKEISDKRVEEVTAALAQIIENRQQWSKHRENSTSSRRPRLKTSLRRHDMMDRGHGRDTDA